MSPVRPSFILIGRRLEPEHHRLRDFLTRIAQPFEWIEAGSPAARRVLGERGLDDARLPLVVDAEEVVEDATVERLVEEWRMTAPPAKGEYDLAIVGPARPGSPRRSTPPPMASRRSCWSATCRGARPRTPP